MSPSSTENHQLPTKKGDPQVSLFFFRKLKSVLLLLFSAVFGSWCVVGSFSSFSCRSLLGGLSRWRAAKAAVSAADAFEKAVDVFDISKVNAQDVNGMVFKLLHQMAALREEMASMHAETRRLAEAPAAAAAAAASPVSRMDSIAYLVGPCEL